MAKYTTMVRSICESYAGLDESVGYNRIDEVISAARSQIFTANYDMYEGGSKEALETKILKHYYFREIGMETVGVWKHFLNSRMMEIMPYYAAYWKNNVNALAPTQTINLSHVIEEVMSEEGANGGTRGLISSDTTTHGKHTTRTGSIGDSGTESRTPNLTTKDKYSDTPQNGLANVENDLYLTNYRNVSETGSESKTTGNTQTFNNVKDQEGGTTGTSGSSTQTDSFTNSKEGEKTRTETTTGVTDMSTLIEIKARIMELITNIDVMIISDLSDLFMQIY